MKARHRHRLSGAWLLALSLGASQSAPAAPPAPMGVYLGPGCNGVKRMSAYEAWLGRRPERASDFLSNVSWAEMVKAAERSARCWGPTGLPMSFAVPMLPKDKRSTLARGARGEYDAYFVQVAESFVRHGHADAVVRIGWEFNHDWFDWSAANDPTAWVVFWRRIVTAMRSVQGSRFQFDWCTGWSMGKIAPPEVYPGDAYVDIIGMDIYNSSWNPTTPELRWQQKLNGPYGLKWQKEFAAARGKKISFPEWGTGTRPDGRGGGDDAYYIRKMAEWIAAAPVAYHNYWDYPAPDFNAILSDSSKPQAAAAFLQTLGGRR